jgi:hypothetical protein
VTVPNRSIEEMAAERQAALESRKTIPIDDITFRTELYPRARADDATIDRYRQAVDRLPPVVTARPERILVDGYHTWQAKKREGYTAVDFVDLGDLTDQEILEESIRRNAVHGTQLSMADKRALVIERLWDMYGGDDNSAGCHARCAELLSVTGRVVEKWTAEIREEKDRALRQRAWALHLLNQWSERKIAAEMGESKTNVHRWLVQMRTDSQMDHPPDSCQVYDVWDFAQARSDSSYFGRMPSQLVENLLWLYTKPEQTVFDPFAGVGTTVLAALAMGRKVWASDLSPCDLTLPIHQHDILSGWPKDAPDVVDFELLDPPCWRQARGKYPAHPDQLGDMELDVFMDAWARVVSTCVERLAPGGKLAYIISPTQKDWQVTDHAVEMRQACLDAGLIQRRVCWL